MKSLLPGHKPLIEKSIDTSAGLRADSLPVQDIDTHPMSCRLDVLEIVARSFNVDISGLEIEQARRLVLGAFMINRYKGTVFSVKESAKAVISNATVIEHEDEPYHFSIDFSLGERVYDPEMHEKLLESINKSKNVRSVLKSVNVGFPGIRSDFKVAGNVRTEMNTSVKVNFIHEEKLIACSSVVIRPEFLVRAEFSNESSIGLNSGAIVRI